MELAHRRPRPTPAPAHHAVGGTVTRTASTRFGDLAGPEHTVDVEMRASWTAEDTDLDRHLSAWLEVLGNAAGLPPPGVHLLGPSGRAAATRLSNIGRPPAVAWRATATRPARRWTAN